MTAAHAVHTVVLGAGGTLHRQDIIALVSRHGSLQMGLEGLTAGSRQQMIILQVDLGQHQIAGQGRCRADKGFIAARAFMPVNPNDHRQRLGLRCLHHFRQAVYRHAHESAQPGAALNESAAADALSEAFLP